MFHRRRKKLREVLKGKMKVKGKMTALLKNMKAFSYVIEAMTRVDFE